MYLPSSLLIIGSRPRLSGFIDIRSGPAMVAFNGAKGVLGIVLFRDGSVLFKASILFYK